MSPEKSIFGNPLNGKLGPMPTKPSLLVKSRPSNGKEEPLSLSVIPNRASFNRSDVMVKLCKETRILLRSNHVFDGNDRMFGLSVLMSFHVQRAKTDCLPVR